MRYNDAVLSDMDSKVKILAGEHYDALKAEFVDFHNDLRVATVRELTDLGLPYEVAESVLYYVQEVQRGIDPNLNKRTATVAGPLEPEVTE